VGLAFALALSCLEAILWITDPGGWFGTATGARSLAAFVTLPSHAPVLLLVPGLEIVLGTWLAWLLALPLAMQAYLKVVYRAQEVYRARYTPLQSWAYPYDTPVLYTLDDPDHTRPRLTRTLTPLELIELLQAPSSSHLLLLGGAGAGKTMLVHEYLSTLAQRPRQLAFGRRQLPLYIPLQYYALLLQSSDLAASADFSLLTFLEACDLPGLGHVRPYLHKLFRQGRLLLICDGLEDVPAIYRSALDRELLHLFRQTRNRLLLTCTPELYEQSSELVQAVSENLVPRAVFQALDSMHIRSMVERFITELDTSYHPNLPTAGQVMSALEQSRLRLICTTPLYLFALLACIATRPISEIKRLDTRGRLLRAFLQIRLETVAHNDAASDDLLFLRELACVARWKGDSDLLSLPPEIARALLEGETSAETSRTFQQEFMNWAREQQIYFPFAEETISSLAEALPSEGTLSVLLRTYRAALIDVDEQGILRFRHPLLVSALLAEYLAGFLGSTHLRLEEIETLPDDLVLWSEPLALWAGLLDSPVEAAEGLADYAYRHPAQRIRALVACLICLGVAQAPPGAETAQPLQVPPSLEPALGMLLDDQSALAELAALLADCALQGAPEVYQALFPLLLIEGSEALVQLLDPQAIAELFFQRLVTIIDDSQQDLLVKRLVRALSCWGIAVVPRAAWLSSAQSGSGGRLRTAAINVLGGTHVLAAVEPLMACLRDPESYIVRRASNALLRLGADLTLPRLLRELSPRGAGRAQQGLQEQVFPIIERFLNEVTPERQLKSEQVEQIHQALLDLLHSQTDPANQEKARELLVSQGRLADERDSGKIALRMLVQNLAIANDDAARSMTGALKEVGAVATPSLLEQLEQQSSAAERVRILEVLASIRDERALPTLLRLLEDDTPAVQQALATTLAAYAPTSIAGLINVVLHHRNELVAERAEQILVAMGLVVVDPIIRALNPLVEDRTLLLVNVLERAGDKRVVPALVALLKDAETDVALALGVIQALGQLGDERAVRPLMAVLASGNPLLYEGAINALSSLGELACAELLVGLDSFERTPLVTRSIRALLGMQPFPGELLLNAIEESSDDQAAYIEEVFVQRADIDAAQTLASHLFHAQPRTRAWARQAMARVAGPYAVPALLEMLNRPEPAWLELLTTYLLGFSQEAIPALVDMLGDPDRHRAAAAILLKAGGAILPELVPALDHPQDDIQARAISLLSALLQEQPELIGDAVQLFALTLTRPRAREALIRVLTEDLAALSLPALLAGLEDAHLVSEVGATLLRLAQRDSSWHATVLDELLRALRLPHRRHGAAITLVDLAGAAVAGVGALITDPDPQVARAARQILGEIGTPAFPFLWAAHSDASNPARREAAREVFRAMPTPIIKDELVELLTSARQEDISMALALLLERVHDEALQAGRAGEMLSALLEHVQSASDERASLRILALLLLLGAPVVAQPLVDALYANPQRHQHLIQTFLLLGQGIEDDLLTIVQDKTAPVQLQAEAAGILAMRAATQEVCDLALNLSEHGLWAGRSAQRVTTVLQASQLDIALRALGGLLVSGHWDSSELQDLRAAHKVGSAQRELIDVLLGWRYNPEISRLQQELETERKERNQELVAYTQELLILKTQNIDLEHDLEMLRQEHDEQHRGYERQNKELQESIADLNREKQQLQSELRQVAQEKQVFASNVEQAVKEQEHWQAEAERWKTYSQQLEKDLQDVRRPGSGF
jgi:HEAT repeat protein